MKSIKWIHSKILFISISTFLLCFVAKGQQPRLVLPIGHTSSLNSIDFSPDGKYILTSGDNTAKVWNAVSGKLLLDITGHFLAVVSAYYSPNGSKIITASRDSTVKIWDAATGNLITTFFKAESPIISASFSSDGNQILVTTVYSVYTLDAASGIKTT